MVVRAIPHLTQTLQEEGIVLWNYEQICLSWKEELSFKGQLEYKGINFRTLESRGRGCFWNYLQVGGPGKSHSLRFVSTL